MLWPAMVPADAELVEITVRVTGITRVTGKMAIAIFDDPNRYEALEQPAAREFVPVTGDALSWSAALPRNGEYAAVVYHDINENGELDRGRFGIPQEPYGFSNDARSPFGPPRFEAVRFAVLAQPVSIGIEIR
jgi:uncharacterized protein (DUF2141 family)